MKTPEEQRIIIAEICGWKKTHPGIRSCDTYFRKGESVRFGNELPDYLNDLNAMHEAEKFLGGGREEIYYRLLDQIVQKVQPSGRVIRFDFKVIHATAAQRAEAFLKTFNLW